MAESEINIYQCPECKAEFRRYSNAKRIKSYCSKANKYVYMKKVKNEDR